MKNLFYRLPDPGDEVEWEDKILQVIKEDRQFRCQYCFFYEPIDGKYNCNKTNGRGRFVCSRHSRPDENDIIFVEKIKE